MARTNKKAQDQALITVLALGSTVENAARRAGMHERTAYRRLADPAFKARVWQAQLEVVQRIAGLLTGAGLGSVKVLVDLQHDDSTPPYVRRGAARDVLELGEKYREAADLGERVAALEEHLRKAA